VPNTVEGAGKRFGATHPALEAISQINKRIIGTIAPLNQPNLFSDRSISISKLSDRLSLNSSFI
jgi:hypothetical protein